MGIFGIILSILGFIFAFVTWLIFVIAIRCKGEVSQIVRMFIDFLITTALILCVIGLILSTISSFIR